MSDTEMLSAQAAAAFLGVHVETIRRLARTGVLPRMKVGRQWRFAKAALLEWAETNHEPKPKAAHILIVDDDRSMRNSVGYLLSDAGYDAAAAENGAEALELIKERRPDLILLDLQMPVMDGATALGKIKEIDRNIPVIIVTGYPDSELMNRALRHGPLLVLAKPVSKTHLLDAVQTTLREQN